MAPGPGRAAHPARQANRPPLLLLLLLEGVCSPVCLQGHHPGPTPLGHAPLAAPPAAGPPQHAVPPLLLLPLLLRWPARAAPPDVLPLLLQRRRLLQLRPRRGPSHFLRVLLLLLRLLLRGCALLLLLTGAGGCWCQRWSGRLPGCGGAWAPYLWPWHKDAAAAPAAAAGCEG
jgi:hypothetical protein